MNKKILCLVLVIVLVIVAAVILSGGNRADEAEVVTPTPEPTPEIVTTPVDELYTSEELENIFSEIYDKVKSVVQDDQEFICTAGYGMILNRPDSSKFPADTEAQFIEYVAKRQESEQPVETPAPPVQQPVQKPAQQPTNPGNTGGNQNVAVDDSQIPTIASKPAYEGDGSGHSVVETGSDIIITLK